MERSGIYLIICRKTNKVYIGQSVHLSTRIDQHFAALKRGHHTNKAMQRDYKKYSSSFDWQVLEIVPIDKLGEREKYWIDHYHALNKNYGYNKQPVREDQFYTKHKERYKNSAI